MESFGKNNKQLLQKKKKDKTNENQDPGNCVILIETLYFAAI